jgi:hypothetical protein
MYYKKKSRRDYMFIDKDRETRPNPERIVCVAKRFYIQSFQDWEQRTTDVL